MECKWVYDDFEDCPNCGGGFEICTTSKEPGQYYDSDDVKCPECGMTGNITVDPDAGRCWVSWHEPGEF